MRLLTFLLICLCSVAQPANPQELALTDRGPRFLWVSAGREAVVEIDPASTPVFQRRVTLNLESETIGQALGAVGRQAGLRLVYSRDVVDLNARTRLKAEDITVAAALTEILFGAGVDVVLSSDNRVTLVPRKVTAPPPAGSVTGKVTDAKAGTALAGATVAVEGMPRSATTGTDGRYRIVDVPAGPHTVRARYIGYTPGTASVTVSAGEEATADLALEKSAQRLDEVVTTGTIVPTEVKALPTPVTVITDSLIAQQRPHTISELFRQAVPSAVSWDSPDQPFGTAFSVRGASTLEGGAGQIKIFVDGVEAAEHSNAGIDPSSIERIEIIRGPQAAAIYGSGALGGVLQIFTKRGDQSLRRPQVDAEAAIGVIQTPYVGASGALRQTYTASVHGGSADVSYNLGGGYSHTADWIPGQPSAQSTPSVYGGMHFARGIITADVSGRYYVEKDPEVFSPDLAATGFVSYSKPYYRPLQNQNQTLGARLTVAATRWWQHTLTVGLDRYGFDVVQTQPRVTTPGDTLLLLENGSFTKASIAYNTSIVGPLASGLSGSLTAGFDHYSSTDFISFASALNTAGSISTPPDQPPFLYRTLTNNTGYFAQAQLGFHDALFITAGLRAEQNTNFGDSLGTPVSPRVGASYAQPVGRSTLKLRGSWGRAIRPPSPGAKAAGVSGGSVSLAAPNLGPERQQGWDAGVDVVFGPRGSFSMTYYDQTADDLIQTVVLQAVPVLTYQAQNVGRVKNTGVEVEAAVNVWPLQLRAQYAYTRSRVDDLGPNYTGDARVGDQVFFVPKHTAGASLTLAPFRGTTVAAGVTYVGSRTSLDLIGLYRCFAGTGPCGQGPGLRDYFIQYPGFVKVNATISRQITPTVAGFVSVDNLANNETPEIENGLPAIGRITTVGFRLHY